MGLFESIVIHTGIKRKNFLIIRKTESSDSYLWGNGSIRTQLMKDHKSDLEY